MVKLQQDEKNLLSADECCVSVPGIKELAGTEDDDINNAPSRKRKKC